MSILVTAGPITADAATAKVVGVKKTITVSASATNKVTGLSKAEKNIVKVTKKGKKFTIKGLKAGKATFKIGKKSYIVKVGATTVKAAKTKLTLTKGKAATLKFTAKSGNGDTLTFKASNKNVTLAKKSAKIAKNVASVKATAKKAGKTTITATSKATGKKATVTVTVKNATTPATATPETSNTPVATATGSATNTPEATATATATASGSATNTPDVTATPVATATATPVATGSATNTPEATEVPTEAPTKAPEVVTGGTITVTGTAVSGATIVVTNASGAAVDTTKRLPAGKYTVSVTKDGYIAQSKEVELADKDAKVVEINLEKMLEVAKVEALNRAEIEVTFTKALTTTQATEAAKASNYTVTRDGATAKTNVANVKVSDDKTSVILLLESAMENNKSANKVVVSKAIGMFTDYTTAAVKSVDVEIPQIKEVTAVGNQMVKITFSEAVDLTNNSSGEIANVNKLFGIYSKAETDIDKTLVSKAKISPDKRTITVELTSAQAAGDYKLIVFGAGKDNATAGQTTDSVAIADFAGYAVQDTTKEFAITSATKVAQATEITVTDRKTIKVTFDNAVTETGKLTWTQGTISKDSSSVELDGANTLKFKFADAIPTGTIDATVSGVTDAFGYKVADAKFEKVEIKASTIATAKVKVESDDEIQIIFSQAMQSSSKENSSIAGDAANKDNYKLVNAKGETVDLSGVTATYTDTNDVYKVTLKKTSGNWDLAAGTYTLTVSNVKDTYGDVMTTVTDANVVVTDTTKPTVVSTGKFAEGSSNGDTTKIAITFSEPMATTGTNSVLNTAAYKIAFNGSSYAALPTNTTITASADAKTVYISFAKADDTKLTHNTTKIQVGVVGTAGLTTVSDVAGNILTNATNGVTDEVTLETDAAPALDEAAGSVYAKSATELYVRTSVEFGSVNESDFEYTVDGVNWKTAKAASLESVKLDGAQTASQYVVLTLADTLTAKTDRTKVNVRVAKKAKASDYKSTTALGKKLEYNNGYVIGGNSSAVIGAAGPAIGTAAGATTDAWNFKSEIVSAEVLSLTKVRVVFSGNVDSASLVNLNKLLEVVNGTDVKAFGTSTSTNCDTPNSVILTLDTGVSLDSAKATTVRTKLYTSVDTNTSNWVLDTNKILYKENIAGVVAADSHDKLKVEKVELKQSGGSAITDGILDNDADKLVITFNAPIYKAAFSSNKVVGAKLGTDGVLTLPGVGKLSGFEKPATTVNFADLTLASTDTTLTVTFGSSASYLTGAGTMTFIADSAIKNAQQTSAVVAESVNAGTLNVAPTVKSTTLNGTLAADKEAKIVFSEALSTAGKEEVEGGITCSETDVVLTFTWSSDNTTVTVKNTHATKAATINGATADLYDLLGAKNTGAALKTAPKLLLASNGSGTITPSTTSANSSFNLVFDEAMDKASVENKDNWTFGSGITASNVTITYNETNNTATFTFGTADKNQTNVKITAKAAVTDFAGIAIDTATESTCGHEVEVTTDNSGFLTGVTLNANA